MLLTHGHTLPHQLKLHPKIPVEWIVAHVREASQDYTSGNGTVIQSVRQKIINILSTKFDYE